MTATAIFANRAGAVDLGYRSARILKLNMSPDNRRISGATGYCLVSTNKRYFIFFVENADSVTIDLNGILGSQPVILVNAK